jgi:hypothetical protein
VRQPYRDAGHQRAPLSRTRTPCATTSPPVRAPVCRQGFHVIGDAALDVALAGFRAAADIVGAPAVRAARHRLEHVEMVDADAVATLADLAITASVPARLRRRVGRGRAGCTPSG